MTRFVLSLVLVLSVLGFGSLGAQPASATCSLAAYSPYTMPGYSGTLRGQFRVVGCGTIYIQVCVLRNDGVTVGCRTQYTNANYWWYESYNAPTCYGRTWAWANGYGVYTSGYATCT